MRLLAVAIAAFLMLSAFAQAQQVTTAPNYQWSGPQHIPFIPGTISSTPPYEFTACRSSTECVPFSMPCAAAGAVNERFLPVLEEYKQATRSHFSCGIGKPSVYNVPVCVSGHCVLGAPTINASDLEDERFCTAAAECTVATDKCGRKVPVNTLSYNVRQERLNNENTGSGCDWTENRPIRSIDCKSNRCTVMMDNHSGQ